MKIRILASTLVVASVLSLVACSKTTKGVDDTEWFIEANEVIAISDEFVALADGPIWTPVVENTHPGTLEKKNGQGVIDYSNNSDGYIMVKCSSKSGKRLKAQVTKTTTYTYDIQPDNWTVFPLSDGNGSYKVTLYENTNGDKYATVLSASFSVNLKDEFVPFLRSNQYVNYDGQTKTLEKAKELANGETNELKIVEKVYDYVVSNLTYDTDKAKTVKSGYLPVLDTILEAKKGICFDYASLMAGMLRSQGVPCKLVVGYAGKAYHAWISVYTEENGWVDGVIIFDGQSWKRMDPTFASSAQQSEAIMKYIGDGSNYTAKYIY